MFLAHHGHFDPGYTDLAHRVMRAYEDDLDRVAEYCAATDTFPPESRFRFIIEQAGILIHYLRRRPADQCARMLDLLRQGRVEVNALAANLITESLGAEEMARALYGALELRRRYAVPVLTAEHNDIPGVSWSLATMLMRSGIRYFCPGIPDYFRWGSARYRPLWDEEVILPRGAPQAFWWEAATGAKLLFYAAIQGAGGDSDASLPGLAPFLEQLDRDGYRYASVRYLLNGGMRDNAPPRVEFAHAARRWNERWAFPRLTMATNLMFFRALEAELDGAERTWRGEIPGTDYPVGELSTARETAVNRATHDLLPAAEKFATIAEVMSGAPSSADAIAESYENTLAFDEHVWGVAYNSGPAQEASLADKHVYAYRAAALAHDVETKSLNWLADIVARADDGCHVVVFNPLGWPRTDLVRVPFDPPDPASRPMFRLPGDGDVPVLTNGAAWGRELFRLDTSWATRNFRVVDVASGGVVHHQVVRIGSAYDPVPFSAQRHSRSAWNEASALELHFVATDVPGLGYRLFRLEPLPANVPAAAATDGSLRIEGGTLENRWFRIDVDERTGGVASLFDKVERRELLDSEAPHRLGEVVVRELSSGAAESGGASRVRYGHLGPVSASLVLDGEAPGCPRVTREIILHRELRRIDIAVRILKDGEAGRDVYISFPFQVDRPRFTYETPAAVVRWLVDQLPGTISDYAAVQHWVDVSGDSRGIALSSPDAPQVEFGGLWPGYVSQAHHGVVPCGFVHEPFRDPDSVTKGHLYSYVVANNFRTNFHPSQVADLLFRYSMLPHAGGWRDGGARRHGWETLAPLSAVHLQGTRQQGLPPSQGFIELGDTSAVLLCMKRAEQGDGLALRFWESEGRQTRTEVRLPWWRVDAVRLATIGEEAGEPVPSTAEGFTLDIGPWDVVTVIVTGTPTNTFPPTIDIVHP